MMCKNGFLLFAVMLTQNVYALTQNPTLTVITPSRSQAYTRQMLLSMPLHTITINNSRAYLNQSMSYQAVKLYDVLKTYHVLPSDMIELISTDNFSAVIPAKTIMNWSDKAAVGYVAIEPCDHPWPKLKYNNPDSHHPKDGTAGPFAAIWLHPEKSYISNEYWAWKLAKIKVHHDLDKNIFLRAPVTSNKHIQNGYHAYISRCSGCHTINKIGKGVIGPDLHDKITDVEKFKKFIRDPQSVRVKANDRMSGTSEDFLSNKDLDDLIVYLQYMFDYSRPNF